MKTPSNSREVQTIAELFDLHAGAVYAYLLRLSGDAALADDLANETFYRAMLAIGGFRGDASVRTWLLKIARNLYLNRLKRERRTTSLESLLEQGMAFPAPQPGPEAEAVNREGGEALQRALLSLSETDRSILLLASQERLPYEEIAQVTGLTVTAVKVRIFRARQRLAGALDAENKP